MSVGILIPKSFATSGKIPIITNLALPNPSVPNANAIRILGKTNQTELIALLILQGKNFLDGIENVFNKIKGSCFMLILTEDGIIAARDKWGRTPIGR